MFNDVTFIFDIDGTLCPIKQEGGRYEDLIPYAHMIEKLRWYHSKGAKIVLFTSRNMNTYRGNLGKINIHTAKTLLAWLEKWDIPYDELLYGKPWPGKNGFYVDDRTIRPDEFLEMDLEEMDQCCKGSRKNLNDGRGI